LKRPAGGLVGTPGIARVGGLIAGVLCYNAVTPEAVEALTSYHAANSAAPRFGKNNRLKKKNLARRKEYPFHDTPPV